MRRERQPEAKKRFSGIDIIKILACFLVISVHFFLHSGFYMVPLNDSFGRPQIVFRWIAFLCVPLFMITTGYLMRNKTLSLKYYAGLLHILIFYLIIGIGTLYFKIHYHHLEYTLWTGIRSLLHFQAVDYAWYVEYYITLFLLIPFINAAYNSMQTKQRRLLMLLTVAMLTSVSQSVFIGEQLDKQIRLFPGCYLQGICVSYYPFLYYLIGMFIRDYPPRRHKLRSKLICLAVFCGSIAFLYVRTWQQTQKSDLKHFVSWHFDNYGAWPVVLAGTSLFLLLFDIRCRSKMTRFILKTLSNATFCAFLLSYIYDSLAYRRLIKIAPYIPNRFHYAPLVILYVFTCSILSGVVLQGIYHAAEAGIRKLHRSSKQRQHKQ